MARPEAASEFLGRVFQLKARPKTVFKLLDGVFSLD